MKKFFLTLVVAMTSLAANAQWYVGGEVGAWRNSDDNYTQFTLRPEFGYNLSDKWAVGAVISFTHTYNNPSNLKDDAADVCKDNAVSVEVFGRWTYAKFGPVSLFLDMGAGVGVSKNKAADDSYVAYNVGVKPGVKVGLTPHLDFVAHAGFLGYQGCDDVISSGGTDRGFGFDVNSTNLNFGLYYNF